MLQKKKEVRGMNKGPGHTHISCAEPKMSTKNHWTLDSETNYSGDLSQN